MALSVDVEEWYHNCWIPEYVDPTRRGRQVEGLDRLLSEWVDCGIVAFHQGKVTILDREALIDIAEEWY